jgi:hypothetical protein
MFLRPGKGATLVLFSSSAWEVVVRDDKRSIVENVREVRVTWRSHIQWRHFGGGKEAALG